MKVNYLVVLEHVQIFYKSYYHIFFTEQSLFLQAAREADIEFIVNRSRSELPSFEIAIIEAATNNFSVFNKIGEGGFGPVYKVNHYSSWLIF